MASRSQEEPATQPLHHGSPRRRHLHLICTPLPCTRFPLVPEVARPGRKQTYIQLWGPLKPQWAPTHPSLPSASSLQVQSPELRSPATEGGARHTCPWRPRGGSVLGSKLGLLTAAWHTREAWLAASPSQPSSGRSASALTSHRACQLPQHLTPLAWFPRDPKRTLTTSVREVTYCVSNPHRKNRQVCYPQVDR